MKKFIHMLSQDNWRKRSKLLPAFDLIDSIFYIWPAGVCEQTSVSQGPGSKFGSTASDTADSITE
jgi:hypothetical protein